MTVISRLRWKVGAGILPALFPCFSLASELVLCKVDVLPFDGRAVLVVAQTNINGAPYVLTLGPTLDAAGAFVRAHEQCRQARAEFLRSK